MPPTESSILTKYLLLPSTLPAIVSLADFTAMFPKAQQASPHIRTLYHDLQEQRAELIDAVAANIKEEVARGRELRRAVARQRRQIEADEGDDEIAVEQALLGPISDPASASVGAAATATHSLSSIIPVMDAAMNAVDTELQSLQAEEEALLEAVRQTVGSLSDLRYGRLANADLRDEVVDGLRAVETACEGK
ncbi:Cnl2/NKP2 family protein [Ceratocystis platani]|uniref:Cnl2/NKP2 family protein n=1 Tax=Ceratocystis fimbriata f. sp. platani TaxID=88771 RepID=A0A0F8B543_CERFI|nr:Cnl2/NKP2 family protein [Ceratocystis platani]